MAKNINDDFDPKDAFTKLAANFDQPDKFANIFCQAIKTQKPIDEAIKNVIKSLIQHDKESRDFIKGIIKELEKENIWIFLKKFGFLSWTLLVAVLSAIAGAIIKTHF